MLSNRTFWTFGVFLCASVAMFGQESVPARALVEPFWDGKFPERLPDSSELAVVNAFPKLTFEDPIGLLPEPRSTRLHVYTRQGQIYSFENSSATSSKALVLDIRRQTQGWDDCGLLGMAFHPEFGLPTSPNRGDIYVYYQYTCCATGSREQRPSTLNPQVVSSNRLSRFTIPDGSMHADLTSELVLIDQRDRNVWHNGGGMFFHPDDGFLYLSLGDEGGSNSQFGNDQTISRNLFSGVIRIDVDRDPARSHPIRRQPQDGRTANYFVPNDNPFVDPQGGVLEEFWSLGLREPHRMTFDPVTRSIWAGDVGQQAREEINLIEKGGNYQWAFREGTVTGPRAPPVRIIGQEKLPVYEYSHARSGTDLAPNNAVIGGYIYRGVQHAALLAGQYIFGDNGSGRIWALEVNRKTTAGNSEPLLRADIESVVVRQVAQMPPGTGYGGLSGFGIGQDSEIYLCQMGSSGKIYRLVNPLEVPGAALPPRRLSQTGLFTDLQTLQPALGLIPYWVNSPLWSDGATKLRWIAIPNNGVPYTTNETIQFDAINEWTFPKGTLFVKHFSLPLDETAPGPARHLETRVLVRDSEGGAYGVTYRWRDDQSDADLLLESATQEFAVKTVSGERKQVWHYPGPRDCMSCHTPAAGYVLGVNTGQLNLLLSDPVAGAAENQLHLWNRLGLFQPKPEENSWSQLPHLVALDSASATLQDKVRSYLAANCAQCHRPGGVRAALDARYQTPLALQGLIGAPVHNKLAELGLDHTAVIIPGAPGDSALLTRVNRIGEAQMPPLARNRIDFAAVDVISHWIRSLPAAQEVSGLTGQYFADTNLSLLRFSRNDVRVSFNWGLTTPSPEQLPSDSFSIRWTGFLLPNLSGRYTFQTRSDDGVRLWLDGNLVIANWTGHASQVDSGTADLIAGRKYSLRLEYYEAGGRSEISLLWQPPGRPVEVIPQSAFSSAQSMLPAFLPPYLYWDSQRRDELHFNVENIADYQIESSENLRNWIPIRDLPAFRGTFTLRGNPAPTANPAFFRIVTLPPR